ncbi:MAG: pseudouridine synthase, partial [Pseudomonadota bacterium]
VLFADDGLVAINKPAGVPSLPRTGADRGTAAGAIVARYPECGQASPDAREGGLVHRLDTGTSGVLIAARSRADWNALRDVIAGGQCEKLYLAEVHGQPPDQGHATAAIGRTGRRGGTVRLDGGRHPQPADTHFTVVARGGATALVEARLSAGRPHQVRVHLAGWGYPIVGDPRYGDPVRDAAVAANESAGADAGSDSGADHVARGPRPSGSEGGLRLHALAIRFRHPSSGNPVVIEAALPWWAASARFRP